MRSCTIILILMISLFWTSVPGVVLRVPSEYPTISSAMDASAEGDTVLVAPGLYPGTENTFLNFDGKDISLLSEAGPERTILDGGQDSRGLWFSSGESSSCLVSGFTICHCITGYLGGGILIENHSNPTIRNMIIEDNSAGGFSGSGGGIACFDSSPILEDLLICGNFAESGGGGIMITGDSYPSLSGITLEGNCTFGQGGGLRWDDCNASNLSGIEVRGNTAGGGGGLSINFEDTLTVTGTIIEDNQAEFGGGIFGVGTMLKLESSILVDNRSYGTGLGGGLLFWYSGQLEVRSCTIANNRAQDHGSGVYLEQVEGAHFEQNIIAFGGYSEGIYWDGEGSEPTFICNDVYGNDEENYGGALSDQTGLNGNISEHPRFCGIFDPPEPYSYELRADSPCVPEYNDCGVLMGALGVGCVATAVEEAETIVPSTFRASNYPNPFNPQTEFRFLLPEAAPVTLRIFDLSGRLIRVLLDERFFDEGEHHISWKGRDDVGRPVATGIYLGCFESGDQRETLKLMLIR